MCDATGQEGALLPSADFCQARARADERACNCRGFGSDMAPTTVRAVMGAQLVVVLEEDE
jgi:hypothetical protein